MADVFVSLNRGQEGFNNSDFVTGSTTSGGDMEFRFDDAVGITRKDIYKALCAFQRWFNDGHINTDNPVL